MDWNERVINVLHASRVFGALHAQVLADLASLLTIHTVPGGSMVFREGEASDSMLFVISGGLRVSRQDDTGAINLYNEVRPGQSVGEIGLILQQPRTSNVMAMRDSCLALLSRASFESLLQRHPVELNRAFVKTVYDFMRHETQVKSQKYAQAFVVIPLHDDADAGEVASSLVKALSRQGSAFHFKPPADAMSDMPTAPAALLSHQPDDREDEFDFLVYQAQFRASSWSRRAFRQSDQIIFVARAGSSCALEDHERRLSEDPGFSIKRKHLVLLHRSSAVFPLQVADWRGLRQFERVYPLRQKHSNDFARLARFLTETPVGVVLGGGGARGFAHLGVLRALEETGIPVDLLGGNSMGALLGAQYACGASLTDILERTRRFAAGGERITVPVVSLLSGRRVERDLKKMFGETMIEDLWQPFFATACNLTRGEMTAQDSGPLWRAVLASNSPAGLFPPVLMNGDLLVDGAILDNVPVDAMRVRLGSPLEKRRGNGTIIAIDVDVREGLSADPSLARLSAWRKVRSLFSTGTHGNPGIGEILYSAGHIGGTYQRSRTIAQSDFVFEPPVSSFTLMGYAHAPEIAEVGYRYAMEKIDQWNLQKTLKQEASA
jgi:NTE family protein/lysophospholipid hydrolase